MLLVCLAEKVFADATVNVLYNGNGIMAYY